MAFEAKKRALLQKTDIDTGLGGAPWEHAGSPLRGRSPVRMSPLRGQHPILYDVGF